MLKGAVLRYLVSDALSLIGNSIAGVVLPLVLLARTGDALAAGSWSSGRWDDCFSVTAAADGTITVSLTDAGRAALSPGSYVLRLAYQPLAGTFAERFSGGVWTRQAQGVTVLPLSVKVTA